MLQSQDRDAIEGLFDRLDTVTGRSGPRDGDAEVLIQQRLRANPPAPYYMAQAILVQEQALRLAEQKIADLEAQLTQRPAGGGGFLGGLFGDTEPVRSSQPRARGPWDRGAPNNRGQRGGGGFLAGAAETALGVTTGVLLGSAIAGMFSGEANADEFTPDAGADQPGDSQQDDAQQDDFDAGGDDFDVGGDF